MVDTLGRDDDGDSAGGGGGVSFFASGVFSFWSNDVVFSSSFVSFEALLMFMMILFGFFDIF